MRPGTRAPSTRLGLACCLLALLAAPALAGGAARAYVAADAPAGGDGSSWASAFTDLQDALDVARAPGSLLGELWIAEGVYRPDRGSGARELAFALPSGLVLYGGFAGDESELAQRDPAAHPTVLSGDLAGDDLERLDPREPSRVDNSFHVVVAEGTAKGTALDGLVVRGGNASGDAELDRGGGLLVRDGWLGLERCTLERNAAGFMAGALFSEDAHVVLSDTLLQRNVADRYGAVGCDGGSLSMIDCEVRANRAALSGAAALGIAAEAKLVSCRFAEHDGRSGPVALLREAEVLDCLFEDNRAESGPGALDAFANPGHARVERCTFRRNVGSRGGALSWRDPGGILRDCLFEENEALDGGALHVGSQVVVERCTFRDNRALASSSSRGGAVYAESQATLRDCSFERNRARFQGGALSASLAVVGLARCSFVENELEPGTGEGGALFADGGALWPAGCVFVANSAERGGALAARGGSLVAQSCLFLGNRARLGGVVHSRSGGSVGNPARLVACTAVGNVADEAGGVLSAQLSYWRVADCVLWGNTAGGSRGELAQLAVEDHVLELVNDCVEGWSGALGGADTFGDDPRFVDELGADGIPGTGDEDLHLVLGSRCIDAGDDGELRQDVADLDGDGDDDEALPFDLDGLPRLADEPFAVDTGAGFGPIVDLGAYESPRSAGTSFCAGDGSAAACPCANPGAPGHGCASATSPSGVRLEALELAPAAGATGSGVLAGIGFPSAAAPSVVALRSTAARNGGLGTPFGSGLLCLEPPVVRLGSAAAAGGQVRIPFLHAAGPGTFQYQLWFRAPAPSACAGAAELDWSNGLSLAWP